MPAQPARRARRAVAALLALAPAAAGAGRTPPAPPAPPPAVRGLAAVDSLAAAEFARDSVASLTVGVVTRAGLAWTRSYGYADVAARRPASRRTVYRIGSVTKMFTGLMLRQLEAEGRVRLDDPAERFYPEIRTVPGVAALPAPVTIRELATMTAGLPREPREAGAFWTGPTAAWQATLARALPHAGLAAPPGTRFLYSNVGYAVLGAALERAAGVPYVRWQETRVLAPLGMTRTAFDLRPDLAADLAPGYDVGPDGRPDGAEAARELREGRGYKVPVGAVFTTVDDLARFVRLWMGGGPDAVYPAAALDRVLADTVPAPGPPITAYGTGVLVAGRPDGPWYGHDGGVAGYVAVVFFDRARDVGVIVLRNARGGRVRTGELALDLMRQLADAQRAAGR